MTQTAILAAVTFLAALAAVDITKNGLSPRMINQTQRTKHQAKPLGTGAIVLATIAAGLAIAAASGTIGGVEVDTQVAGSEITN